MTQTAMNEWQRRKEQIDAYYSQFMTGDMDKDFYTVEAWDNDIQNLNEEMFGSGDEEN